MRVEFLAEWGAKDHRILVLFPALLWFPVGQDAPGAKYADLSLLWLRGGLTLRFWPKGA